MLKLMRDSFHHLKWILIAIVAAFVFGFVFLDMGLGGATRAGGDERAYAARVNGETITYRDYDRALYYTEQNYRQLYGGQLTPEIIQQLGLPRQVLDSLVEQRLLLQEARRLDLTATPDEIRKKIREIPVLNPDGKFVGGELYARYITGSLGYQSAAEFEEELAREITLSKFESALASSVVISRKAAEAEYRRMNENAKIRYVLDPATRHLPSVTVTPAEVEAYYKANQANYSHGEQRRVKYLLGDFNRLRSQITPSEADMRKRYEATKDNYKVAEGAHIFHILIKVDPDAAPEVDAAARSKAQSLVSQLRAGADFATLARANSADPSSAGSGGDMGFVERGQTVDPFDKAAFSIPLNQISDPIRSKEFGYHIIKVVERRPASVKTFEEVKAEIASQLQEEMAKEQAREEMTRIMARVRAEKPKTPEQFAALANDKVSSNDSQWFQKSEQIPGIGFHQPLTTWAFGANQGDIGEMIGTQRGVVIPYLFGVRPAGVTALAEIREKVENDARTAKARETARAALQAAMAGATSIDAVATKAGVNAAETTVTRQGGITGITGDTAALVAAAMSTPVGQMSGPIVVGNGALVFQVTEQKRITPEEVAKNIPAYADTLRAQQTRSLRTVLLQRLRKTANVDVNDSVLQSQSQQPAA
jgi:peptidyl-prolyl cis-trans isomerase D